METLAPLKPPPKPSPPSSAPALLLTAASALALIVGGFNINPSEFPSRDVAKSGGQRCDVRDRHLLLSTLPSGLRLSARHEHSGRRKAPGSSFLRRHPIRPFASTSPLNAAEKEGGVVPVPSTKKTAPFAPRTAFASAAAPIPMPLHLRSRVSATAEVEGDTQRDFSEFPAYAESESSFESSEEDAGGEVVAGGSGGVELVPVTNEKLHEKKWEITQRLQLESPRLVHQVLRASEGVFLAQIGAEDIPREESAAKQAFLFLPGVDGSGATLRFQQRDLTRNYNFWLMFMDPCDRSSFEELTAVSKALVKQLKMESGKRVVVMGESFGGLAALGLGLEATNKYIERLILVNPASSYERTPWKPIGEILSRLPDSAYLPLGAAALVATVPDTWQANAFLDAVGLRQFIPSNPFPSPPSLAAVLPVPEQFREFQERVEQIRREQLPAFNEVWGSPKSSSNSSQPLPPSLEGLKTALNAAQAGDSLTLGLDLLGKVVELLPQETLRWRLENWLQRGCDVVNPVLSKNFGIPTLVLAGTGDRMIPSEEEASRLQLKLGSTICTTRVLRNTGHAAMDMRINITNEIQKWKIKEVAPKADPVLDFIPPNAEQRKNATQWVDGIRQLTAPVFYSTDKNGKVVQGLANVPLPGQQANGAETRHGAGTLLVGNHQLYGIDLGMIIEEFINERGVLVRGLAHPLVARGAAMAGVGMGTGVGDGEGVPFGGSGNLFQTFGAVPVSGRNLDALMRERMPALLFPGGVREVYHRKGEDYKVFWPQRGEFIRAAAKHNATVVPFSAIGVADSVQMVADAQDILKTPVLGDNVKQRMQYLPRARDNETFVSPVSIPKMPHRFYFLFGKPFDTTDLDYRDKAACQAVYEEVRRSVEDGIEQLLARRDRDPFKEYPERLFYEVVNNKPAPTPDLF